MLELRPSSLLFALVAAAASIALPACGPAQPAGDPGSVLKDYGHALEQGHADEAYSLLSDDAKRSVSVESFRRMVKDDPDEVRELGRALQRSSAPAVVTATVTAANGQELDLVLEDGRWRVEAGAVDLYAQDTPRHAVQGFVRALERKRYDVILRFVPDAHKEGLNAAKLKDAWEGRDKEEMAQVLSALKQVLPSASVEETGDHAALTYGAGTMQLVKEHGLWKIEDFD
jgi:hypothetical protein